MAPREEVRLIHTCWPFGLSTVREKKRESGETHGWEDMKETKGIIKEPSHNFNLLWAGLYLSCVLFTTALLIVNPTGATDTTITNGSYISTSMATARDMNRFGFYNVVYYSYNSSTRRTRQVIFTTLGHFTSSSLALHLIQDEAA